MNVSISSIVVYYDYTAATGVTLSQTEAAMTVGGETLTLTATVAPNNATDKTVTWTTSDASVATVANGVVTAVAAGTATITATVTNGTPDDTSDDKTATCTVTVSPVDVMGVTLSQTEASMIVGGETLTLTPTVAPDNASFKTVTWTTSDASVATVADGVVTAVGAGTAAITATATNGTDDTSDDKTATCAVTVTAPTTYSITVKEGTEDAANWTVSPNPAEAGQTVTISYTGTKKVKSVKAIKKAPATVPVTAITLNKTETTITKVNGTATETLSVTAVTPDEATDKTYTWSSDAAGVATVDENGVVTAVAAGTAHIRATANDGSGVYGECTVTVSDLSAFYSKMGECGCGDLDGKCVDGSMGTFTGQDLSAAQAIALAQAKAAETNSNCAVFYGMVNGFNIAFAKNDGTTGSAMFFVSASQKGLSGYRGYYVSK